MRKSKRAKTEEQEPEKKPARGRTAAKGKAAKESGTPRAASAATAVTSTRRSSRRKASIDAQHEAPSHAPAPRRATRQSKCLSGNAVADEAQPTGEDSRSESRGRPRASSHTSVGESGEPAQPEAPSVESAKIALPMSDTPIINRNKEMRRKGNSGRRSSLGSRGRRASSLIESGQAAIPHREVDAAEFYKHIEAEGLPEPRRMKQLLMWCGERALAAKPPHGTPDANAMLGGTWRAGSGRRRADGAAARAIQDQLLKDFASRSEFSDWFSRDKAAPEPGPRAAARKPNPRNLELDEKMASLEGKISRWVPADTSSPEARWWLTTGRRLQEEKKAWLAIGKPPPEEAPLWADDEGEAVTLPDFDLLDADEGKIRGDLADEGRRAAAARAETEGRLRRIQASLELEVDQLADNVHKLEQRVRVAGKEADGLLRLSAARLRAREQRERTRAGTRELPMMEVLRSLSGILPEGGCGGGGGG